MKWLPNKGSQGNRFGSNSSNQQISSSSTSQISKLIICFISTGVFLSGDVSQFKTKTFASVSPDRLSQKINDIAADISVKISGADFLGSGFIVKQQGQNYVIITNQHVLRAGEAPYTIQTADGQTYQAEIVFDPFVSQDKYDLAILKFQSDVTYPTATIGSSLYLEVGEPIFAAGFPSNQIDLAPELPTPIIGEHLEINSSSELVVKQGRVAIILNQALEDGYQIGYTNDVKKGMSGGPLFNSRGEVVGVNGKHAYPLWESPELYQDGSQPCPALQELITRTSLAIPIEKSIELTPLLETLRSPSNVEFFREPQLLSENPELISKMQAEAEAITRSCENLVEDPLGDRAERGGLQPNREAYPKDNYTPHGDQVHSSENQTIIEYK